MFKKSLFILIFFVFIFFGSANSSYALSAGCDASPASLIQILTESLTTLYNIFPIQVGNVNIMPFGTPNAGESDVESASCDAVPVCECLTPVPRIGIHVAFWEPVFDIETVKSPFCFPALGVSLAGVSSFFNPGRNASMGNGREGVAANIHLIDYPVFALTQIILTGDSCPDGLESALNVSYISELDPTWKDDETSVILNPESLLVANPIAQLACIADSVASNIGYPIDALFWCQGDWGNTYPQSAEKGSEGLVSGAWGLASRGLFKACTVPLFLLWDTTSCAAECGPLPLPMWKKSQFGIYEAFPSLWPWRTTIGQTGMVWDHAMNPPIPLNDDNFDFFVYQHINCCLL